MKLEFPAEEGFTRFLLCHTSLYRDFVKIWNLHEEMVRARVGSPSSVLCDPFVIPFHPTITDAADAAIISVIQFLRDRELYYRNTGSPNKFAEIDKLLNDFLKSHRPTRKKTAKQPTP